VSQHFEQKLHETAEDCARRARCSYRWTHVVFIASVLGSFAAAVLVAGDLGESLLGPTANKAVTAALAALPGLMLLINNTLRFEERTKWFWRKARLAERYHRQLRDGTDPGVSPLSRSCSEECEKLEAEWPAFDATPGQPTKPGT